MSLPFVSVIIPVYNNASQLRICLEALENQTYLHALYEVVVVDNGSKESIKPLVSVFKQAIAAYEDKPGSYAARNKGFEVARGEVIAFTDSDCIPCFNWIEEGVKTLLQTQDCGLVAGKIDLFFRDPERPTAVELYESITALKQEKLLKKDHYGVTANLFTYRKIIEEVGLFNSDLKSHGDLEWGQRVFMDGYKQTYAYEACVAHPARLSLQDLYIKTTRLTGGHYMLRQNQGFMIFLRDLCRDLLPPFRFTLIVFKSYKNFKLSQQISVIGVRWFVKSVSAYERIRMQLGETAKR